MLIKWVFTIVTAVILTFSSINLADQGGGCPEGDKVCVHAGGGIRHVDGEGKGHNGGEGESCTSDKADLTTEETHWLLYMREEEKVARDSYLLLGDLWGLAVFSNIAASEQHHMDAMKKQLDCYGLTDPVIHEIGVFADPKLQDLFDSLMKEGVKSTMDGLYVGAAIEETDIVDIQDAIDTTEKPDIVSTYESLMCGSRNHLRAFIRQVEINGGSYAPSVLDEVVFWAIAYSDMERDCGTKLLDVADS